MDYAVHLIEIGAADVDDALLSAEERARAARFRFERDRARFVASHAALHAIVGEREVAYTDDGKPYLRDGSLHFNLSHSGDFALIAVSPQTPVGVDIERHRERISWERIAQRFFTPREVSAMQSSADFYRLWVMKEAVLKAIGTGLRGGLANVECGDGMATTPHGEYRVTMIDVPAGYSAAVAMRGSRP